MATKTITKTIDENEVFIGFKMTKAKAKELVEANAKLGAGRNGFDAVNISTNDNGEQEQTRVYANTINGKAKFFRDTIRKHFAQIIATVKVNDEVQAVQAANNPDASAFEASED